MPEPLINLAALEPLFAPQEEPNRVPTASSSNQEMPPVSAVPENVARFVAPRGGSVTSAVQISRYDPSAPPTA